LQQVGMVLRKKTTGKQFSECDRREQILTKKTLQIRVTNTYSPPPPPTGGGKVKTNGQKNAMGGIFQKNSG